MVARAPAPEPAAYLVVFGHCDDEGRPERAGVHLYQRDAESNASFVGHGAEVVPLAPADELDAARATIAHAYRELLGGVDRQPEHADLPHVCRNMRASLIERRRQVAKLTRDASSPRAVLLADLVAAGRAWLERLGGAILPAGPDGELLGRVAAAWIALAAFDEQLEPPAPTLTDDQIRAERDDARFAGDQETARLCSAALGLEIGDGAHGRLDPATCRERLARRLAHRTMPAAASKDPAP